VEGFLLPLSNGATFDWPFLLCDFRSWGMDPPSPSFKEKRELIGRGLSLIRKEDTRTASFLIKI